MPIVSIRTIKGILTEDKKAELHKRIADLLVDGSERWFNKNGTARLS